MNKVINRLYNIYLFVGIIFFIWIFVSWIDVIIHNTNFNPNYLDWNFFSVMLKMVY